LQTVLFENGAKITSPFDVYMTLLHLAYGTQDLATIRKRKISAAQTYGQSLLSPLAKRSCSKAPFSRGLCSCGWVTTCPGPIMIGTNNSAVESKQRDRRQPLLASILYENALYNLIIKDLKSNSTPLTCGAVELKVIGCDYPAVLFDEFDKARFEVKISDQFATVYEVQGHSKSGDLNIESIRIVVESTIVPKCESDADLSIFWRRCYCE